MRAGMSRCQALEGLEVDVRDLRVSIRDRLVQESALSSFSEKRLEQEKNRVERAN
jgi:hypothetical protein